MNKKQVMAEALVLAFGWHRMSGMTVKETAAAVVTIFATHSDPDHRRHSTCGLLRLDERGRAMPTGNQRVYERWSINYRQLMTDLESFEEVLKS